MLRVTPFLPCLLIASLLSVGTAHAQQIARASATTSELKDLPLKQIPALGATAGVFAVFITGDGGWAGIDKEMTAELAKHGISVVGMDSRVYLRTRRTPDELARDVARIVRHYQEVWHRKRFVLVGYSRGADLFPFAASRMDDAMKKNVALLAMVALATRVGFEFHFEDIFHEVRRMGDLPTLPEIAKLRGMPMICVYGSEDKTSGCPEVPATLAKRLERKGSHHFDGDYTAIADLIITEIH